MLVFGMFLSSSIQKEYSAGLEEGSNYKDSDTSYLINIPESYYEVIEYINQDLSEFKVAMFPYAVINSLGWMNIPKLKYVGGDIFSQLLNNDMLLLNSYHNYTTLNFGEYWNEESTYNSEWMMYYLGNIGVKYIIYNKNFPKQFIGKTLDKMGYLESVGLIDNILENQDIILYKIGQDYVNNLFYIPNKVNHYTSGLNVQPLFDKFSKDSIYLKENLTFESNSNYIIKEQVEINPTKYKVKVKCSEVLDKNFIFIFNHKYTDSFKVFLKNTNDGEYYSVPSAHYKVNDYSNLWSVDVEYLKKNISDNYFELEIIYYPQMIRDMFLYISLIISIIFSLMYFYLQYYKMHAKK